ncbi:MAG: radical SAM protein [Candidatus Niyogibacteria bacterium]|nr:radical SAM protein [Candidatus Niyogibacteria bacterium]
MRKQNGADVYSGFNVDIKNENVDKFEASQPPEYKEYREKWEEYPKKLIIPEFPLHLDIGITSKCNLKCPMCTRTQKIGDTTWVETRHLEFEFFQKAIDEGGSKGLCAVDFDNFGEPLLNPNIFKMISYAKSKGILDVFFHTNATALNEINGRKLIEAGLDRLIISFDSPYKEKYEKIRIGAKFEKVLRNIKNFAELKKQLNVIRPLTRINCIKFHDITRKEIEDTIALFSPIVDAVSFIDYVDPVKSKEGCFDGSYESGFICPQIITRLTIWEDGMISPCCMDYDRTLCFGNLKDMSLEDAWKSRKLQQIREKHFSGKFFEIPSCRTCDFALESDMKYKKEKEE